MVERNRGNSGGASSSRGGGSSQPTTPGGMAHQQATQVKEQVQQTAADLKEQVTGQATGKIEEQKAVASDGLSTVAHAFRQTGTQLREQEQDGIAQYLDRAAGQIEQFGDYLGRRNLRDLARDAEQFAHREPALFLGGAFTLGLFAARFLKSTSAASGTGSQQAGSGGAALALPAASSYQPPVGATAAPSTYGRELDLATAPLAGLETDEAIVGGPPISSGIIVGGPPHEPGQEPRR